MNIIISFLKKNLIIILIVMAAGNIFYFLKKDKKDSYYHAMVKVRTKSLVYDRLNDILKNMSLAESQEVAGSDSCKISYKSYRNEENYIFEIYADCPDSSMAAIKAAFIIEQIKADSLIGDMYFEKTKYIDKLLKDYKNFYLASDTINSFGNSYYDYDKQFKNLMIDMNIFNLINQKITTRKEFEIYPFSQQDVTLIKNPVMKNLLRINFILFVIGIFSAIVIRQLRN